MRSLSGFLWLLVWLSIERIASAQLPPEKALAAMQPAAGLQVSLFAAEPDLVNPTCMDIDPQGRVWVCEAVNYRGRAKPPFRKTGDRIVVLEDTDGDGRADRSRVFYEGPDIQAPLGICWLSGRIYVSQSPGIFSIEIRPDGTAGEKRDFLTGFRGINHDHGVHSLVLGPDGLFYCAFGNEGADVTDRSGRRIVTNGHPYFGGMAFRVTTGGTGLEALAHNFRNNYECALDSFGTIFQSDNDDDGNQWVRFVYVMQGGNYGFLGPTGRHWSEEKKSHWHMEDPGVVPILLRTGAGSPCGLCVYEGELLPEKYRGVPIHADAGPRVVQCFPLEPKGAGYHVAGAPLDSGGRQTIDTLSKIVKPDVLLTSTDTWFRPSDVTVAPDGSLFVADWYDPGVGGHGMGDTSRGRIYRLVPEGHSGYRSPRFDPESAAGLAEALSSPAVSVRGMAVLKLLEMGKEALPLLEKLGAASRPAVAARALWLLGALDEGRSHVERALSHGDPRFRVLAVRCLKLHAPGRIVELVQPLLKDPNPQVRREALLALRDVPGEAALQSIAALANQYDGQDRFYLAAIGIACRGRESQAFRELLKGWEGRWTPARGRILWEIHPPEAAPFLAGLLSDPGTPAKDTLDIVRTIAELEGESGGEALVRLLQAAVPPELKRTAAGLLGDRLGSKWAFLRKREELRGGAEALLRDPTLIEDGVRLVAAGNLRPLRPRLETIAASAAAPEGLRVSALQALGALDEREAVPLLARQVEEGSPALSSEAVVALGRMSGAEPVEALKKVLLAAESADLRSLAVKSLGGSKSGALLLIRMAQESELPEAALALSTTVVHSSAYEDVRLLAEKALPRPKSQGGRQLPPAAQLLKEKGDAAKGRKAFFDERKGNCGRCHRIQKQGSDVGPDLSVIGAKFGREALLESILSPSASISHEYKVWILQTRSAGFVSGYIVDETGPEVTIRDANGKRFSFKKEDVIARTPSDVSLMPEGLVGSMTPQDLMDIVEFLGQRKPGTGPGAGQE